MIEVDHTEVPPPEPARPILASNLLAIEKRQRKRFSGRGERIRTGCGEIDDCMLGGGFERGIVVGISAEAEEGRLISLHLLSSILLSHVPTSEISSRKPPQPPKTKAAVIDTTGSFPILLLAQILKTRIQDSRSKYARHDVTTGSSAVNKQNVSEGRIDEKSVDEEVRGYLEMVAISRVFDVEGLWEVLGEVGRDSAGMEEDRSDEEGMEIIIIDNMTHLINELFARKERGEAHTLLTTLSRTLHILAHTQNILTLLHNTTVSTKSYTADPSIPYPDPYQPTTSRKQPNQVSQPTSIFPSNPIKPALGQIFSQLPELHVLMSQLPKTREDAERLYGKDEDGTDGGEWGVEYCYVVEVLKDETPNLGSGSEKEERERVFAGREQRWAAVEIGADGLGLVNAFIVKGNMRDAGLKRERGRAHNVGSIARVYGFGGRRV